MLRTVMLIGLLGLLINTTIFAQNTLKVTAKPTIFNKSSGDFQDVTQFDLYQLDGASIYHFARKNKIVPFTLHLEIDETRNWEMQLEPARVHGDDFHVQMSSGERVAVEKNITFKGYLKNMPETRVRMTISNNLIQGLIFDDDMNAFETIAKTNQRTENDIFIFYKMSENNASANTCGHDHHQYPEEKYEHQPSQPSLYENTPLQHNSNSSGNRNSNVTYCPKLGVTLDWQGLNHAGSVSQFNSDMQAYLNIINGYHDTQFSVEFELTPIYVVSSAPNPWPDNSSGTGEQNMYNYRDWAKNNFPSAFTATMLMTGQNFNGFGWGMINKMCTNEAACQMDYQYNQSILGKANVMTHELGHVWGCQHGPWSQTTIMSPTIFANNLSWTNSSANVINNKIASISSCLPSCSGGGGCSPYVDNDNDGYCSDIDCDDNDSAINPGAAEICDGIDNNCNGQVDENTCTYCTPIHTGSENELITNVTLNTINNNSGGWTTNVTGYSDYTNISTQLSPGTSYTITVTPNYSWYASKLGIWADWNQNQTFDANETIASLSGTGPWTANFTPPANAVAGTTRLRIRLQYGSSYTPDPCAGTWYYSGETEDYSLIIGGCNANILDTEGFESGWGMWNDGGADARKNSNDAAYANTGNFCVRLRDNTSTSVITTDNLNLSSYSEITVDFSYEVQSFENTEDFWLQISTNGGTSFTTVEDWVRTIDFQNGERHNPSVTINGPFSSNTKIRFRCDASGNGDKVYLDDIVISGCGNTTNNLISPENETDISDNVSFEIIETDELENSSIHIYPNPVSDNLTLEYFSEENHYTFINLFNLNGQIVLSQPIDARKGLNHIQLNVSQLSKGIYYLNVLESEGVLTKQVVISR